MEHPNIDTLASLNRRLYQKLPDVQPSVIDLVTNINIEVSRKYGHNDMEVMILVSSQVLYMYMHQHHPDVTIDEEGSITLVRRIVQSQQEAMADVIRNLV